MSYESQHISRLASLFSLNSVHTLTCKQYPIPIPNIQYFETLSRKLQKSATLLSCNGSFHFIWHVVENNLSFQSAPLKQWCYIVCVVLICPVASCLWPPPGVTPIPLSPHTFISETELLGKNSSQIPQWVSPMG